MLIDKPTPVPTTAGPQTHIGERLDGQVLSADVEHARQSIFQDCSMVGTALAGDWRGSDFLGCDMTGADLRRANTYGAYWRGSNVANTQFPADIGYLHHEVVAEIIRQRIDALGLTGEARATVEAVVAFCTQSYAFSSWDTSKAQWWDNKNDQERDSLAATFRLIFEPYPILASRFGQLEDTLRAARPLFTGKDSTEQDLTWPDGTVVHVDASRIPPLADRSRHTVSRWIEEQAGPDHYVMVMQVSPLSVWVLPTPDYWLTNPKLGY